MAGNIDSNANLFSNIFNRCIKSRGKIGYNTENFIKKKLFSPIITFQKKFTTVTEEGKNLQTVNSLKVTKPEVKQRQPLLDLPTLITKISSISHSLPKGTYHLKPILPKAFSKMPTSQFKPREVNTSSSRSSSR